MDEGSTIVEVAADNQDEERAQERMDGGSTVVAWWRLQMTTN